VVVPHRAAVEPMPPQVGGALPWIGAGLRLLAQPAAFFAEARHHLGDTYAVDAFGYRLFCVFSPAGVRSLYALAEDQASFGLATYHLLSLKLPPELFEGRRTTARTLFGGEDVERYLASLETAVRFEIAERGTAGTFEVFATIRRLGHRLGLASWIGPEAAAPPWLGRLMPLFDQLDSSDAYALGDQRLGGARPGALRSRALPRPASRVRRRRAGEGAGEHLRPRVALVPGAAIRHRGDPDRRRPADHALRLHTALRHGGATATAARGGGASGGPLHGGIPAAVTRRAGRRAA
jgi:hypothetical protein